ncbi:MAG: TerB family tellurite resistance protein [Alphaproteobacteria bacterium]|nr:TerB family tellurite resistance protein [Alphaproteobacteria bacterium]
MAAFLRIKNRRTTRWSVVERPSRATAEAIVATAAAMACADGQAEPAERAALHAFLRRHGFLILHGRDLLTAYDDAVSRTPRGTTPDPSPTVARLQPLAGTHAGMLAATAAAHVAVADGVTWPQEIALLRVIRDRLGISAGGIVTRR